MQHVVEEEEWEVEEQRKSWKRGKEGTNQYGDRFQLRRSPVTSLYAPK